MAENICTSCGATVPAGTKFCSECGSKVSTPLPEPVFAAAPAPAPQAYAQPQTQFQEQPQPQPPYGYNPAQAAPESAPSPVSAPVPDTKPMSVVGYLLMMLVFSVPVVGVVLAFLWALGKNTARTRKIFALAQLIAWGIFFMITLIFYILHFSALNELIKVILS